jgi:hypothetical protein
MAHDRVMSKPRAAAKSRNLRRFFCMMMSARFDCAADT